MPIRDEPQAGMFDQEIEDDVLEELIDTYMQTKADATANAAAKRRIRQRIGSIGLELTEGARIRVGRFVVTGARYDGGGFEVPAWSVVSPRFEALD